MSDPVEVLGPARAAEWTTALREAAAGVPGEAGPWASRRPWRSAWAKTTRPRDG